MTAVQHSTQHESDLLSRTLFPPFSFRSPSQLLINAKETPPVKNGLLHAHQAAYCLAWNTILNTNSEPRNLLYSGIGPDISTPLLTTNATKIVGTEVMPVKTEKLITLLDAWELIDTDPARLRGKIPNNILSDCVLDEKQFHADISARRSLGFWTKVFHERWGLEWCLMYELKTLGVDPASIKIGDGRTGPELSFNYQHPSDIAEKPRTLEFAIGLTQNWVKTMEENRRKFDIFYAKSNDQKLSYETVMRSVRTVHERGVIILGHDSFERRYASQDLIELDLRRAELPPSLLHMMETQYRSETRGDFARYGWKLNVYGKRACPIVSFERP